MNAFLLLYAMALSIELILSMLMALFLFLLVAPRGRKHADAATGPTAIPAPLARAVDAALADACATISEGRDDLATITNARSLLSRYVREQREAAA